MRSHLKKAGNVSDFIYSCLTFFRQLLIITHSRFYSRTDTVARLSPLPGGGKYDTAFHATPFQRIQLSGRTLLKLPLECMARVLLMLMFIHAIDTDG